MFQKCPVTEKISFREKNDLQSLFMKPHFSLVCGKKSLR